MRRAQSVRNYTRPTLALGADDLGVLREGDESNEDVLRRQLLEKDRECDRLQNQIQALTDQLSQRPPLEQIQELEREYRDLELLLNGTQRENEKFMAEIERGKTREKMLERELTKLAGENWQSNLDFGPNTSFNASTVGTIGTLSRHHRSNTMAMSMAGAVSPSPLSSAPISSQTPLSSSAAGSDSSEQQQQLSAHLEQVRLLVMGMDQRLQGREDKLKQQMKKAEQESARFERLRKEVAADA
ncbi:hypothetical protein K435DRAFT_725660 [Dendrothele bispora CBS 962.96]|uniref:Uncharacterized protein n=1 Tax=Dendrothele bispora (strain CBS 962.96) TaxID=1314807 RepID=A0A4S8LUE8_DENBC|nr:hypothetical protein K435DRAFT_725660 [Dendrothele bispora CBS 962.96]